MHVKIVLLHCGFQNYTIGLGTIEFIYFTYCIAYNITGLNRVQNVSFCFVFIYSISFELSLQPVI